MVIDGLLTSAELTNANKIHVEEIKYATMDFEFRSRNYSRRRYSLDFVTLVNMNEYLIHSTNRHQDIFDAILRSVGIDSNS